MTYYLDGMSRTIWNKETLEEFELNDDAFSVLEMALSSDGLPDSIELMELKEALLSLDIDLNDIEILGDTTKSLMTPIVHIIKNCNSRCLICDCWKRAQPQFLSAGRLQRLWPELRKCGAESVMLSGGEPLMHPELGQIISDVHDAGLAVELNTNGILLDKFADRIGDVEAIVVSIDGFTPRDYAYVRGVDKLPSVTENMRRFSYFHPETLVGARCTLTRLVLSSLDKCIEFVANARADVVSFSPLDATSSSFGRDMTADRSERIIEELFPPIEEVDDFLKDLTEGGQRAKLISDAYREGLFSWSVNDFERCLMFYRGVLSGEMAFSFATRESCSFPKTSLVVDYDGSIKPCFYADGISSVDSFSSESWGPASSCAHASAADVCAGCRGKVFCGV